MAEIHRIVRIASDSSSIDPVRRYTDSERKAKMEMMEDEIKEHAEMLAIHREIKEKYPNPENLSFTELLEQGKNQAVESKADTKDDEGFILDIKYV